MDVYRIDTNPDPKKRDTPLVLSSKEMRGNWTFHAFVMAHDGRTNFVYTGRGFELHRDGEVFEFQHAMTPGISGVYWSPDSSKVTLWTNLAGRTDVPKDVGAFGLGVLDVRKLTSEMADAAEPIAPPLEIVYAPPIGRNGYGVEWSPSGDAIYVLERATGEHGERNSQLVRVPYPKGEPVVIARMGGMIDFFMPPVSRFEHGEGPSKRPYWIVFGHARGLFLVDPKGRYLRRLAKLPATGLQNVEWHPGRRDQLALYFKHAMVNSNGERFKGVYLVHLDRLGKEGEAGGDVVEPLHGETDVHTLWYSPRGKYISWATADAIYLRSTEPSDVEGEAPPVTMLTPKLGGEADEERPAIKGYSWHPSEKRIAVAAGNAALIFDVEHPEREPLVVARLGRSSDFVAEPVWDGDDLVLTQFCDIAYDPDAINKFNVEAEIPEEGAGSDPKGAAQGTGSSGTSSGRRPPDGR